jgi:surface antigen
VKRHALVVLALLAGLLGLAAPAHAAAGDDYPYRTDQTNHSDRWGFTMRQCVSFAAWRLAQTGHPLSNSTQGWGSAYKWDDVARARHLTVTTRPKVGAVAQWNGGERSPWYAPSGGVGTLTAGPYGHVAWVRWVYSDGSVLVEQYNMSGDRSYSTMRVKAPRYLYLG